VGIVPSPHSELLGLEDDGGWGKARVLTLALSKLQMPVEAARTGISGLDMLPVIQHTRTRCSKTQHCACIIHKSDLYTFCDIHQEDT
jgi:hypothetical protein